MLDKGLNAIIRPPRTTYNVNSVPTTLCVEGDELCKYSREPITIDLPRNEKIVGSIYHKPTINPREGGPCVVYMHGNASCQLEGQFLVPNLCKYKINVFTFDFIGCGCSSGDHITLGYYERKDTEFVLEYLSKTYKMGPFVLWGRSMGAATALMVEHPKIIGIIADSPFSSLRELCENVASKNGIHGPFLTTAIWVLGKKISSVANFNIDDVSPLKSVKSKTTPILFGHAKNDEFIPLEHTTKLYTASISSIKDINILPGGHNNIRNASWLRYAVTFILERFNININFLEISECRSLQSYDSHFESFRELVKAKENKKSREELEKKLQHQLDLSNKFFTVNVNNDLHDGNYEECFLDEDAEKEIEEKPAEKKEKEEKVAEEEEMKDKEEENINKSKVSFDLSAQENKGTKEKKRKRRKSRDAMSMVLMQKKRLTLEPKKRKSTDDSVNVIPKKKSKSLAIGKEEVDPLLDEPKKNALDESQSVIVMPKKNVIDESKSVTDVPKRRKKRISFDSNSKNSRVRSSTALLKNDSENDFGISLKDMKFSKSNAFLLESSVTSKKKKNKAKKAEKIPSIDFVPIEGFEMEGSAKEIDLGEFNSEDEIPDVVEEPKVHHKKKSKKNVLKESDEDLISQPNSEDKKEPTKRKSFSKKKKKATKNDSKGEEEP